MHCELWWKRCLSTSNCDTFLYIYYYQCSYLWECFYSSNSPYYWSYPAYNKVLVLNSAFSSCLRCSLLLIHISKSKMRHREKSTKKSTLSIICFSLKCTSHKGQTKTNIPIKLLYYNDMSYPKKRWRWKAKRIWNKLWEEFRRIEINWTKTKFYICPCLRWKMCRGNKGSDIIRGKIKNDWS